MSSDDRRIEWKVGWPRGTWVKTIDDRVFEVGFMGEDSEGSKGYLLPLYSGHRIGQEFIYVSGIEEARTSDGHVFRRHV